MKFAVSIPAEKLVCLGVCFGKITKGGKFMLHITALEFLHPYCQVVYYFMILDDIAAIMSKDYYCSGLF